MLLTVCCNHRQQVKKLHIDLRERMPGQDQATQTKDAYLATPQKPLPFMVDVGLSYGVAAGAGGHVCGGHLVVVPGLRFGVALPVLVLFIRFDSLRPLYEALVVVLFFSLSSA